MPGSSNQGSLLESPSNPPPQPWPQHAQAPLVPRAGPSFWGLAHLSQLHPGLVHTPRGGRSSLLRPQGDHLGAEGKESGLHPMPTPFSFTTWAGENRSLRPTHYRKEAGKVNTGQSAWAVHWIGMSVSASTPTNGETLGQGSLKIQFLQQRPASTLDSLQHPHGSQREPLK